MLMTTFAANGSRTRIRPEPKSHQRAKLLILSPRKTRCCPKCRRGRDALASVGILAQARNIEDIKTCLCTVASYRHAGGGVSARDRTGQWKRRRQPASPLPITTIRYRFRYWPLLLHPSCCVHHLFHLSRVGFILIGRRAVLPSARSLRTVGNP
jgi:hypothetical protein